MNYSIEKYNSKNGNFDDWSEDFRALARITKCTNDDAKHLIRLYLDEAGKAALRRLDQADLADADTIIEALRPHLRPIFQKEEAQDALEYMRRGNRELEQFGRLIAKTVAIAYPSMSAPDADEMVTSKFIRGLDGELRQRLEYQSPKTFQQALQIALQQERNISVQMSERKEKNIKQDYYKLQTDLKNMQKKDLAGLPQGNPPKEVCQLCQRENHIALQC